MEISCKYDLEKLFSSNTFDHPRNENIFYELYLEDYNGDLIDIPVLITSLQKGVATPNAKEDSSKW